MGRPRKTLAELIAAGTFRPSRHGPGRVSLDHIPCRHCGVMVEQNGGKKLIVCQLSKCKQSRRSIQKQCVKCSAIIVTPSYQRKYCDDCSVIQTGCVTCGKVVSSSIFSPKKYCSNVCKVRATRAIKTLAWRTYCRFKKMGVELEVIEFVEPFIVFNRDQWKCWVCGFEIDRQARFPSPRSPSIDHVIPITKGGEHTYENCKLACLQCNNLKRATLLGGI